MKTRKFTYLLLMVALLAGFSTAGRAAQMPNPNPANYADDINGSGLFNYGQPTFFIEAFDIRDANLLAPGLEFGFYFAGASDIRTTVFDSSDFSAFPLDPVNPQRAGIDFTTGQVGDIDETLAQGVAVVQDTFDFVANTPIGFYLQAPNLNVPLFTQALLNTGGEDVSGTFRRLGTQFSYLITFSVPNIGLVSANLVGPVGPISPVPLPGAAGLWLLGLAGIAMFRRYLSRSAT